MSETVEILKKELLDAIVAAEDYGYDRFVPDLVAWHGPISAQEIADFANSCIYEGSQYTEEDVEIWEETLIAAFHKYGKFKNA